MDGIQIKMAFDSTSQITVLLKQLLAGQNDLLANQAKMMARLESLETNQQALRKIFTGTSCHRVINTTELLEEILINLPVQDLLLSQRVSKHFKAVIDGSIILQRALFFLPEPIHGAPRMNEILVSKIVEKKMLALVRKPRERRNNPKFLSATMQHLASGCRILLHTIFYCKLDESTIARLCISERPIAGSWQKMYLSQCPVGAPHEFEWTVTGSKHAPVVRQSGKLDPSLKFVDMFARWT